MRIPIFFLLLATFAKVSTSVGVYNRESSRVHRDFQNGEFLYDIGDWLGYLKNRINERLFGQQTTTTPSPVSTEIISLDKFQFQRRLRNREWFLLDLSNLTFDPKYDWGFRVGNWHFIRKGSRDQNGYQNDLDQSGVQSSQTTSETEGSEEVNTEETFETTNDLATTEFPTTVSTSTQSEMPSTTQETDTVATLNTVQSYSSERSTTSKWVEDSKTEDLTRKGSVEVLMG